jgi:hypothetical protein
MVQGAGFGIHHVIAARLLVVLFRRPFLPLQEFVIAANKKV